MGTCGVRFQRESAADVVGDIKPLLEKHWQEIARFQDIALDPDFDRYLAIESAGSLRVFTARAVNGEAKDLVGYAIFFVHNNPHYQSSRQATQDILFIDPERRGFGAKFIAWCDEQLKNESVQVTYHHVKAKHNFGPMLERMGYELVDHIYARRLDQ